MKASRLTYLLRTQLTCAAVLLPGLAFAAEGPPSAAGQLVRLLAGLALVIGLVFVLSRVLPRLSGGALTGQRGFRVVGSVPVGQRERVVLMEIGDRQVVLGVAPGRISRLHVLDEPVELGGSARAGGEPSAPTGWLARTLGPRS